MVRFPNLFAYEYIHLMLVLQPLPCVHGRFGLFHFRSPLLAESRLITSPAGTEMFHFPAFATS